MNKREGSITESAKNVKRGVAMVGVERVLSS